MRRFQVTVLLLLMYVLLNINIRSNGVARFLPTMDHGRREYISIFDDNCIEEKISCVNLSIVQAPICVHENDHVSGYLKRTGIWEESCVKMFMQLLKDDSSVNFVDIGANLGIYSIVASTFGRQVIAVDPWFDNLCRVRKALNLGNLHQNVTLLLNGISNKRGVAKITDQKFNRGAQKINAVESGEADGSHAYMKTIILEDLLKVAKFQSAIFKIDIEGYEWHILDHIPAIIDNFNITVFMFEMHFNSPNFEEFMCPRLYAMMASKGYEPFDDPIKRINHTKTCTGHLPVHVFWVKQ